MSFVIVSACDVLYGPTAVSTEDAILHEQLSSNGGNPEGSLTISRRRNRKHHADKHHHHEKGCDKLEKAIRKCEAKLADCHDESKAEKLREKVEALCQRKKDRIAINQEEKINFDPHGKCLVFKVDDAPVRVLNKLGALGYSVLPSAGGVGDHSGLVWTLFRPNYIPTPIYPRLNELATTD